MRRILLFALAFGMTAAAGFSQTSRGRTSQPLRPAAPPTSSGMTNADVIKMAKAGLSESLIAGTIRRAGKHAFDLSADGMVELKTAGISDNIIETMLNPAASPAPVPAPPTAVASRPPTPQPRAVALPEAPLVPEVGVYYKRDGAWVDLPPEVVNWKTGGLLKHMASLRVIKGDVNGSIASPSSKTILRGPVEILIYAPEGTAATEYQLLRLRTNDDSREFRTVTGGVLHSSGGALRDLVPFESKKIAPRTYTLILPQIGYGQYGILAPGAASSSSGSAQLGKVYSFKLE